MVVVVVVNRVTRNVYSVVSFPSHMCGPLPKHEEGYQYTLVVICAFSRWIELFPTKTTTAEETARCILVDGELPIDFEPTMA